MSGLKAPKAIYIEITRCIQISGSDHYGRVILLMVYGEVCVEGNDLAAVYRAASKSCHSLSHHTIRITSTSKRISLICIMHLLV